MLRYDVRLFTSAAAVVGLVFSLHTGGGIDALVVPDPSGVAASLSRHGHHGPSPPCLRTATAAPSPKCSGLVAGFGRLGPLIAASSSDDEESSASSSASSASVVPKKPRAIGTLNVATVLGSCTALAIVRRALATTVPRLFQQHVIGAALGTLVFLPMSIGAVRSRVTSIQAMKGSPGKDRRGTLLTHIYAHFYLTYAVAGFMAVSLLSIFRHKANMGKVHFVSVHSRVGLTCVALWMASYIVAQIKVWTPMLKRKEFKYDPSLLWASRWHKRLGTAAAALSLGAVATGVGLSAWGRGAFVPWTTGMILAGVTCVEAFILWPSILELQRKRAKKRLQKH